jgi:hypothetical protein
MFALFLLILVTILIIGGLLSAARQAVLKRQAAEERKPLEQAAIQTSLVNVEAPAGFVAPIIVTIADATGRTFRVVIDEQGQQHPEPAPTPNGRSSYLN